MQTQGGGNYASAHNARVKPIRPNIDPNDGKLQILAAAQAHGEEGCANALTAAARLGLALACVTISSSYPEVKVLFLTPRVFVLCCSKSAVVAQVR